MHGHKGTDGDEMSRTIDQIGGCQPDDSDANASDGRTQNIGDLPDGGIECDGIEKIFPGDDVGDNSVSRRGIESG